MNLLRTIALFAFAAAVPQTVHATSLDSNPVAASLGTTSAQPATMDVSAAGGQTPGATSVFTAGPFPVGDARWAYRAFSVTAEGVRQPEQVDASEDPPSPTPEPAGLFLLGSGAFITALSIRYRLFAL